MFSTNTAKRRREMICMSERVFVDTNVLLYARDDRFPEKQAAANAWLSTLVAREAVVISPQILGEFCNAALRKALLPEADVRTSIALLEPWSFGQVDLDLVAATWKLRSRTRFRWWDCMILASAIEAGCRYLLSEDLTHQRTVDGVTIIDPFELSAADLLASH